MTVVSQTSLAGEIGISRVRVGQYIKAGLPIRADAKLDRETALAWIASNVDGPAGQAAADILRGPATRIRPDNPQPAPPGLSSVAMAGNSFDQGAIFALLAIFARIRAVASLAAHEAGAPRDVAERAGNNAMLLFAASAEEFLKSHGIEPFSKGAKMSWPHPDVCDAVDWAALGAVRHRS